MLYQSCKTWEGKKVMVTKKLLVMKAQPPLCHSRLSHPSSGKGMNPDSSKKINLRTIYYRVYGCSSSLHTPQSQSNWPLGSTQVIKKNINHRHLSGSWTTERYLCYSHPKGVPCSPLRFFDMLKMSFVHPYKNPSCHLSWRPFSTLQWKGFSQLRSL